MYHLYSLSQYFKVPEKCMLARLFVGFVLLSLASLSGATTSAMERFARPLERRFPRAQIVEIRELTGVIVLGGRVERLLEAGRLARSQTHLKIFASGAGELDHILSLLGQDISPDRVRVETQSRSTLENAVQTRRHIDIGRGERWLLITSAMHMPRAMGVFRKVGFDLEPWPVYDIERSDMLGRSNAARHEWLGLAYYWLRASSSSLFPGPHFPPAD